MTKPPVELARETLEQIAKYASGVSNLLRHDPKYPHYCDALDKSAGLCADTLTLLNTPPAGDAREKMIREAIRQLFADPMVIGDVLKIPTSMRADIWHMVDDVFDDPKILSLSPAPEGV